ncbi:hypothetical protein SLEP1_g2759 [Rubroshorea leprosula]|uniref:Fungal lipase-type domain-containing protein n=1 Tax=Rubroshorea leprosula TaxID=152421 RepID=A0AAV5HP72_9ROSI|nr:hypothetical protein SLEP1_g2759 [Rubroshorea leprosula]
MRLSIKPVRPCPLPTPAAAATPRSSVTTSAATSTDHHVIRGCTIAQLLTQPNKKSIQKQRVWEWERLLEPVDTNSTSTSGRGFPSNGFTSYNKPVRIGKKWMEYQGIQNWEGLLDPLDNNLRSEILRYGHFVEAAYKSFDFDTSSPTHAKCRFPQNTMLQCSGLSGTGYSLTKYLHATAGIQLPASWIEKAPSWMATRSSWIGYVAVCQDEKEISRLGRRDVLIAYRGTATCLEWLENFRATLTHLPDAQPDQNPADSSAPMVESGFLSLYTSRTATSPSLQDMVREEISRLLQIYGDEPLSITITGHSLGAALATLTAYDIKTTFNRAPMVTVISFGCPRVGNRNFGCELEKQGTKVLRIVNTDDLITKVPGFVIEEDADVESNGNVQVSSGLPSWIQKRMEETQWVYADVGRELKLCSRDSPYLNSMNVATCHDLKTYLHLVNGYVSSTCPYRPTATTVLNNHYREEVMV